MWLLWAQVLRAERRKLEGRINLPLYTERGTNSVGRGPQD